MEAQAEEELPEKLLGTVRVYHYQVEMSSATFVKASPSSDLVAAVSKRGLGFAKGITTSRGCEDREDEGKGNTKTRRVVELLEIRNI